MRDGIAAALAGVRVELPAVVGAFDRGAVEAAKRKRKGAVRADIAQRERLSGSVAPDYQRNFEQHGALKPVREQLVAAQRGVPEAPEQAVGGIARVRRGGVAHQRR